MYHIKKIPYVSLKNESKNKSPVGLNVGKEKPRKIPALRLKEVTELSPEVSGILFFFICCLVLFFFDLFKVRSLLDEGLITFNQRVSLKHVLSDIVPSV